MGRLLAKATYDYPAEYAQTETRAVFEIRIKFALFNEREQDWAVNAIKAIMDEFGWALQSHAEAVKVEQIPIIVNDTVDHRMIVVSLNFDTSWVNSTDIGEWWGDYIEDPDLWNEEGSPYCEIKEFAERLKSEVCNIAENSENVDVFVRYLQTREER